MAGMENFLVNNRPMAPKDWAVDVAVMLAAFLFGCGQLMLKMCIRDRSGTVCGMRLRDAKTGAATDVRARAVVMATGGFASSQPLVHANVPAQERIGCYTTASMGEGQLLCAHLGGQLDDMGKAAPLTSDLPEAAAWGLSLIHI